MTMRSSNIYQNTTSSVVIQIKIDGFDPDKFKAANNQTLGSKSNIRTSNINNNYNTNSIG